MAAKLADMTRTTSTYYKSPIGVVKISGTANYISEVIFLDSIDEPITSEDNHPLLNQCVEELMGAYQIVV
jgi:methylated-DNA-[protein]-cysteine S-methyltransferase